MKTERDMEPKTDSIRPSTVTILFSALTHIAA